ncbi:MAG: hypothetical protein JXR95_15350 [Deltaproteobacteria bacterium]|nr:hypothetical protein [Deltaproteobacteria bacterium]
MHDKDFEQLIQTITDLVLAKLQSIEDPANQARTLTVIWPAASSAKNNIIAGISAFRQAGHNIQWLIKDDIMDEITPLVPDKERSCCHSMSLAPVQTILGDIRGNGVVLIAAANFHAAGQILSYNDEIPWIHVLLQAHLAGQQVLICDDLLSSRGLSAQNPVTEEAQKLKRQLEHMDFKLIASGEVSGYLKNLTLSVNHGSQGEGGLLTERDVEDMFRAGHRELRLHAKTLVTPLAHSKAAELGLNLLHMQV